MTARTPFYVTTPIYYVNDVPHIGHAYTTLACDVLARFKRLDGFDVRFLTGTDEHGQKVEKSARDARMEPRAFTDKVSQNFRDLCRHMNFSNDDFIRTTEPRHIRACQALWQKLKENGHITLGAYKGWYAVRDEAFYAESELAADANGQKLAPSGAPVEWVEEPSYFFRLSAWQKPLLDFYEANPGFILPLSRRNEVTSFVKAGLQDLSVSRTSFRWGVPVPDDPAHIMYVWLDALTNYITAVGYPDFTPGGAGRPDERPGAKDAAGSMNRGASAPGELGRFWPADLHMVGKDILRFHAVYWPAFLMAAGVKPPKRVFAHGWWTNEGQKISKSVGNVIDPIKLIGTYGLDQLRYFLLREVPFGNDGDFSHRAMVNRMNGELANDYGNLAQRVLSMIARNCSARVPEPGERTPEDKALAEAGEGLLVRIRAAMDVQAFHEAIEALWVVIRAANAYVDHQAPWKLKSENPARMGTVLYVLAETVRKLALLTQPFVPDSSARLLDQLAVPPDARAFDALVPGRELKAGTVLPEPKGVFPRYVEEEGKP